MPPTPPDPAPLDARNPRTILVPGQRLLFWFAVIVLPFSVLGMVHAESQWIAITLILGLAIAAVLDAVPALNRLDGISVELPPVIRFSTERPGTIEVVVRASGQPGLRRRPRLRLGIVLPSALGPVQEETTIEWPGDANAARLAWVCHPIRRGRFILQRAHLECPSRLGFWSVRGAVPVQCEVRVYPSLRRERKNLAALFLNRGTLGMHAFRQVGKGREFEKLREYVHGDGFDEIHWKATAKRTHPVTKVFQIERTQEIYIVLDASRLSARPIQLPVPAGASATAGPEDPSPSPDSASGAGGSTHLERFITSSLVLAQAAEKQGDLFGLVTFTRQVGAFLRARNGQHHYAACRDALYTLEPDAVAPDFDEIVSFIRTRLRRRALLVFLTSLDDPVLAENFARNIGFLARQHLVVVNTLRPPGVMPLFSQPPGEVTSTDDLYRHLGGHLRWQRLRELQKALQRRGVQFNQVDHERMAVELVSQYLGIKQRQLL